MHRFAIVEAKTIARAWLVHCCVIGVLAVTCIATCLSLWPAQESPHDAPVIVTSIALLVYAIATSIVLQIARRRCRVVYAIHAAGLLALVSLVAC